MAVDAKLVCGCGGDAEEPAMSGGCGGCQCRSSCGQAETLASSRTAATRARCLNTSRITCPFFLVTRMQVWVA